MNFKELIAEVSHDTGIPAGDVRKVSKALLRRIASLVEEGGQFKSSILRLRTVTRAPRTVRSSDGSERHLPERRFGQLLRPKATKKEAAQVD